MFMLNELKHIIFSLISTLVPIIWSNVIHSDFGSSDPDTVYSIQYIYIISLAVL